MFLIFFLLYFGLFLSINVLRESGILEAITNFFFPVLNFLKVPKEIFPLILLRPISGSGSVALATSIMEKFGTDSTIGLIVSTIMGCTETTLYVIALYTSNLEIKKTRFVIICALLADFVGMLSAVFFWRIMS